jgi:OmpA-OmpF porin, OOP family
MRLRNLGLATATASVLLLSRSASAQTQGALYQGGFDLQQFQPSAAGDRFFGNPDAYVMGMGKLHVGVLGNYALKPLKLRDRLTDSDKGFITSTQLYAHINASFALANRVLINVDVPIAALQSGDSGGLIDTNKVEGGKIGDVRGSLRINLLGTFKDPIAVALQGDLWFPTGDEKNLTGDQKLRGGPRLVISGNAGGFIYNLNGGYMFRHRIDLGTPEIGPALTFGAGIGALISNKIQLTAETYGSTVTGGGKTSNGDAQSPLFGTHSTPAEALGGVKIRLGDIVLGAGAGPGLTRTPGTPQLRVVGGVFYAPQPEDAPGDRDGDGIADPQDACPDVMGVKTADPRTNGCPPPPTDRDKDGIIDPQDACPDVPGVKSDDPAKNGCPADRDGDGIADAEDACPDVKGVKDADPKKNGCPADKDGDGIPDAEDACVDVPGVKDADPKKNGCPADRDGDGVPDAEDACPDVAGVKDADPKKNGCPPGPVLKGNKIELDEQVHFQTGKDTILPDSDTLLTKVAKILNDHPEITLVAIEGHTDNVGNKAANKILSKKRAAAVVKWLTTKGSVEAKRLKSEGYGQDKPIADNATAEGKAKNRRVEITVLKTKDGTGSADKPKAAAAPKAPAVKKKKLSLQPYLRRRAPKGVRRCSFVPPSTPITSQDATERRGAVRPRKTLDRAAWPGSDAVAVGRSPSPFRPGRSGCLSPSPGHPRFRPPRSRAPARARPLVSDPESRRPAAIGD